MAEQEPPKKNFFISYRSRDVGWAEWIAWQLKGAGYTFVFQKWQWSVGNDFLHNMQDALQTCERMVAVLSPNYFTSAYTEAEWRSVFALDPDGTKGFLIPVQVEPCEENILGLLRSRVRIELNGKEETIARGLLLDGLVSSQMPTNAPVFPPHHATATADSTLAPRFPGQLPAVFRIPHRRNPQFTGRDDELETLHTRLKQGKLGAITQSVTGLGGVDKTAMAVEYCFRYSHEYDTVLWLRAEEDMTSQYAALADDLKIPIPPQETEARIEAVKRWFGQNQRWLLIFDNAMSAESIESFQPMGGGGSVIVTSRARDEWLQGEIPLSVWDKDTTVAYIQKNLPNMGIEDAEKLSKELGYLPLALAQAVAYIKNKRVSTTTYLQRLNDPARNILDEGKSDQYPMTVSKTWNLSFDAVRESQKANPVPEAALLALFSILAPDAIPRSIFMQVNSELEPAMEDWLADLNHYSLIDLQAEELSIHRLVQGVIRRSPNCPDRRVSLELTLKAVTSAHPGYDHAQWAECRRMEPHWLECRKGMEAERVVSVDAGLLCNQHGYYLESQGRYSEAEPLYQEALSLRKQALPAGHPDIATSMNNLAYLYESQGRYLEAEPLYQEALSLSKQALPAGHPDTASSMNNLALLYSSQGRYGEAEPLYQEAVEIMLKVLGRQHPDTQDSVLSLFIVLSQQQKIGEVMEMMQLYPEILVPSIQSQMQGEQG